MLLTVDSWSHGNLADIFKDFDEQGSVANESSFRISSSIGAGSDDLQEATEADVYYVWGKADRSGTDLKEVELEDNLEDNDKELENFVEQSVEDQEVIEDEIHLIYIYWAYFPGALYNTQR